MSLKIFSNLVNIYDCATGNVSTKHIQNFIILMQRHKDFNNNCRDLNHFYIFCKSIYKYAEKNVWVPSNQN